MLCSTKRQRQSISGERPSRVFLRAEALQMSWDAVNKFHFLTWWCIISFLTHLTTDMLESGLVHFFSVLVKVTRSLYLQTKKFVYYTSTLTENNYADVEAEKVLVAKVPFPSRYASLHVN